MTGTLEKSDEMTATPRSSVRKFLRRFSTRRIVGGSMVFILFLAAFVFFSVPDAHAIRVSLKRVVFEGNKRSEILTLINNTGKPQTYRLGWRKYRMDEHKSLVNIPEGEADGGILWADDMIRFAPRRVTVPPGRSQQVRLLFRRPKDLQEAEYRSHLWIVTETQPEIFDKDKEDGKNSVRLAVQPAISLPIFVRNGNLTASASITDLKMSKAGGNMKVSFVLNRQGDRSIYGDFDFVCSLGGKELVLHQVRGISVYTEINKRYLDFDIPLTGEAQSCNNVHVMYRSEPEDTLFKGATLAEASASL